MTSEEKLDLALKKLDNLKQDNAERQLKYIDKVMKHIALKIRTR